MESQQSFIKSLELHRAVTGSNEPSSYSTRTTSVRLVDSHAQTSIDAPDEEFEILQTVVIDAAALIPIRASPTPHPLGKYSVSDDVEALERQMVEQKAILGNIALLGQATAIYAAPNTGKTLIVLHLIVNAISKGAIDPANFFYINMDDNGNGLVAKTKLASEYKFAMLADGHKEFQAANFRHAMQDMIKNDKARGVVVVLDTLKKFVNTMDKISSADFAKIIRQFSLKGGTVIVLGHTNKHKGVDGKQKYAGTSDIVDDFDCAYMLDTLDAQPDPTLKIVEFTNIKRRGNVAQTAAYSYSNNPEISYESLFLSVQEVDDEWLGPIKQKMEIQSDLSVVSALKASIEDGVNSKIKLIKEVAKKTKSSERAVHDILERYTGDDPSKHHWTFDVRHRGAKIYFVLDEVSASPNLVV